MNVSHTSRDFVPLLGLQYNIGAFGLSEIKFILLLLISGFDHLVTSLKVSRKKGRSAEMEERPIVAPSMHTMVPHQIRLRIV